MQVFNLFGYLILVSFTFLLAYSAYVKKGFLFKLMIASAIKVDKDGKYNEKHLQSTCKWAIFIEMVLGIWFLFDSIIIIIKELLIK